MGDLEMASWRVPGSKFAPSLVCLVYNGLEPTRGGKETSTYFLAEWWGVDRVWLAPMRVTVCDTRTVKSMTSLAS